MTSEVPYLPIDQFESQCQEALIQDFEKEHRNSSEEFVQSLRFLNYLDSCDGYSPYVELVLHGMGMQKYASLFADENISIDILMYMTDDDFQNLGITSAEDREHILKQLKLFRVENDCVIKLKRDTDLLEFENHGDDITMLRNFYIHIRELNSHLSYIESQLSKNPPHDYLICDFETSLNFLKFVINHAIIQSNRMSELLFGGQFNGRNMITHVLHAFHTTLPNFMREKLTGCHEKRKKLNKRRVIISVLIGAGIAVAVSAIFNK